MTKNKMTLSEELRWRGFIQDSTLDDKELDQGQWTFYHGFDASADSQTVGNLAAMMFDKVMLRHGHQAVILAGGATSLIGDPGGKDKERNLQSEETVERNVQALIKQVKIVFDGYDFRLVNNLDWTKQMSVLEFLRDIGKHFSMTPLVQRDYIAKRIGEDGNGISYTEFSYTLLQGMDYLHLHDNYGVNLQIGGSDQWGNCLSGVELVRKARGHEVEAITLPLVINQSTGKKFGKSEEGAIWLDPTKTSPYQFYQFWLNSDDEGVEGYLKTYTELDKATIDQIMTDHQKNPGLRVAQKTLASEVTKLIHGQELLDVVEQMTQVVFSAEGSPSQGVVDMMTKELPIFEATIDADLPQVLVELNLAESKRQAREFIVNGAIRAGFNSRTVDEKGLIKNDIDFGHALIRRGKNKLGLIKII